MQSASSLGTILLELLILGLKRGHMTPPFKPFCPYQDGECPHIQEIRDDMRSEIDKFDKKLDKMQALLYVVAGIVSVTCGVSLW